MLHPLEHKPRLVISPLLFRLALVAWVITYALGLAFVSAVS
jgi:hypothetical protein